MRQRWLKSIMVLLLGISAIPMFGQALPKAAFTWDSKSGPVEKLPQTGVMISEEGREILRLTSDTKTEYGLLQLEDVSQLTFAISMRLDPSTYSHSGEVWGARNKSVYFYLRPDRMGLVARYLDKAGEVQTAHLKIGLEGVDRKSYSYYIDNQWHQLVFSLNIQKGWLQMWVDGISPEGFRLDFASGGNLSSKKKDTRVPLGISRDLSADLGSIRVYGKSLSPAQVKAILAMDLELIGPKEEVKDRSVTTQAGAAMQVDPKEFAPGHPSPAFSALQQLKMFPAPHYRVGNTLLPLYNWTDPLFLAGKGQPGIGRDQMLDQLVALQAELAEHWNYMLVINNSRKARSSDSLNKVSKDLQRLIALANEHPEWPLAVTSLWAQTDMKVVGESTDDPFIRRRDLPQENYLRNSDQSLIGSDGKKTTRPRLSLAADPGLAARDGEGQQVLFERLTSWLTRPIDMINENGEVPPLPLKSRLLDFDPYLRNAYAAGGQPDWETWQAGQKLGLRAAYANQFLEEIPALKNTRFSWYAVDGGPLTRFEWKTSRQINRPINGQYYPTPDFYPRWPDNWQRWKGAWHGWEWIAESRKVELAAGDRLFSPFVGAGWSRDPEKNIRPSQWLGLLKLLGPLGAEFFYTGFFIEFSGKQPDLPKPANYIWQLALPAYAQAITSHYEEILRAGDLLTDEKGEPIINLDAGDPRILITVRKYRDTYVIAGAIQPFSNQIGNVPDSAFAKVEIEGKKYGFWVRRQGSVYLWNQAKQMVWQLDAWHEAGHPLHWGRQIQLDACMADQKEQFVMRSHTDLHKQDGYTRLLPNAFMESTGKGSLTWKLVAPRTGKYEVRMLASNGGSQPIKATFRLCKSEVGEASVPSGTQAAWISLGTFEMETFKASHYHTLELKTKNRGLGIHTLMLVPLKK